MRPKSLVLLALAAGCGLIASIGISQVIDSNNRNAPTDMVPIYVAIHNINLGDPIADTMISLQEWPKGKVPVGALTKWEEIENRRPRATIYKGEPLMDGKLLPKGQSHDPISAIPKNHRLKTISVEAQNSAAGLLSPGDRVDIHLFVQRNAREGIPHAFSKTILQNIRVFAVDQTVQRSADGSEARTIAKTVSVILTPKQANRVTLAENLGEISLIPRNPDDDSIEDESELNSESLFGLSTPGSRKQEQGLDATSNGLGGGGGLSSLLQGALTQAKGQQQEVQEEQSSFRMQIIYPQEVSEVKFNNDGEPIVKGPNDNQDRFFGGPAEQKEAASYPEPAESDADGAADGSQFPIDLKQKTN
jgi:pilus assembly protein CpaB